MKTINLILGNHNHQPVGNFDFVIENTYKNAYQPFLEMLTQYPELAFTFHYSGSLIDWMEAHHPEHMDMLASLVKAGRVEMISGGYYEPILPVIPERDAVAQMQMLNRYIKKRFNYTAKGAWIAERVWEPHLVRPIAKAGLSYIVVDDTHLAYAGVSEDAMFGYFTTDNEHERISVFPISKALRYVIPFKPVKEVIEQIASFATEQGDRLLVLHDDGEKYGDWPDTYEWIYTREWLKQFFNALRRETWIKLTTYSDYMNAYPPLGRVYLPTASYQEMGEWVLPAGPQRELAALKKEVTHIAGAERFLRGSYWRNFFVKYPESNNMHKRMLAASKLVDDMPKGEAKDEAQRELFMGQCNCPYWHGTFGGLYCNHLRYANYSHLIHASLIAEREANGKSWLTAVEEDFDLDGRNEAVVSTELQTLIMHRTSGALIEWDYKPSPINLIDTLARREEAYHEQILRRPVDGHAASGDGVQSIHEKQKTFDPIIRTMLMFDKNRKAMFVDHFIDAEVDAAAWRDMQWRETGTFANADYDVSLKKKKASADVVFTANGSVNGKKLALTKTYTATKDAGMSVSYAFTNNADDTLSTVFACECNLTLLAPDAEDRFFYIPSKKKRAHLENDWKMNATGTLRTAALGVADEGYKKIAVELHTEEALTFLHSPVITISDAVDHFEQVYQHSNITVLKPLSLAPGTTASFTLTVHLFPL